MISKSLRAWNVQHHHFPSVFLYQNTPSGFFSITEVEAEISEALSPIEKICLSLVQSMGAITRIELHAVSGLSLDLSDDNLAELQHFGLLELVDFEPKQLTKNLKRIIREIGDDWFTPHVKKVSERKLLKQYKLSEMGLAALQNEVKRIKNTINLNTIITGKPFYLFYDNIDLRPTGYENITTNPNMVEDILGVAQKYSKYTGISPIAIGSNSVIEGKEVANSQFWIAIEGGVTAELKKSNFNMYLSSRTFDRWANPSWNSYLETLLPDVENIQSLIIKSISDTYMMVEDVIEEGLSLAEDKVTWLLEVDLEMQKLIFNVMPEPIELTQAEVTLKYPETDWRCVILMQLEPWDELADQSLKAGRFHQRAPKKGFGQKEGFSVWNKMLQEWDKPVNRDEYLETLDRLVNFKCLVERLPKVDKIIVDVDDVLSTNRRGSQSWQFNRLREISSIIEQAGVPSAIYMATNDVYEKIDDQDTLEQWVKDGLLEIYTDEGGNMHPLIEKARTEKSHYLGSQMLYRSGKQKDREYGRTLHYKIEGNSINIPGLEPFYDWRQENIFEKMYDIYYE